MKIEKELERAIKKGKDLEVYLPKFFNDCASNNQIYSCMTFTMRYFDLYESFVAGDIIITKNAKQLMTELNELISDTLLKEFDGKKREESIQKLDGIRTEAMKRMRVLTSYTDKFSLYEYVLNRLETKFEEIEEIKEESVIQEIFSYIFKEKDNIVVNRKIHEMLSQLPIRLTKGKFFDLLQESLSIYEGTEEKTVEDYIYMIRSASGLYTPEQKEIYFPTLKEALEQFKTTDYRELLEEDCKKLQEILKQSVIEIRNETEFYYWLQEVINAFYAVLLNFPYASIDALKLMETLLPIIKQVRDGFLKENPEEISEEMVQLFRHTEGKLENYSELILKQQGLLQEIKANYMNIVDSFMLKTIFECLLLSEQLLSDSIFIEFEQERSTKKVDKLYIEKKKKELIEEFAQKFKEQPQVLNRAMIANTLKEMPIFFENHNEVFDYIKNAIENCHDKAEKAASIRLLRELIKENE